MLYVKLKKIGFILFLLYLMFTVFHLKINDLLLTYKYSSLKK